MPVCVGRPESGQCPYGKADDSVNCQNVCVLYLWREYYDNRVPLVATTAADDDVDDADGSTSSSVDNSSNCVKSELLCFVSDKCDVLRVSQLVDNRSNFNKEKEIVSARKILLANNAGLRERKGTNKLEATMEDIVTAVLKPTVKLPVSFATEINRSSTCWFETLRHGSNIDWIAWLTSWSACYC